MPNTETTTATTTTPEVDFVVDGVQVNELKIRVDFTVDGKAKTKTYLILDEAKAEEIKNYFTSPIFNSDFIFSDIKKMLDAKIIQDNKSMLDNILGESATDF